MYALGYSGTYCLPPLAWIAGVQKMCQSSADPIQENHRHRNASVLLFLMFFAQYSIKVSPCDAFK